MERESLAPVIDYAFLSDPGFPETWIVTDDGKIRLWVEGGADGLLARRRAQKLPEVFRIAGAERLVRRWRREFLPILELGEEYTLFARERELWVREGGRCVRYPSGEEISPDAFERAAAALERHWENWISAGVVLPPVSPALDGAWRMSLIHSLCAFVGRHPKYGVEKYGEFRADGFPPSIIAMCGALLDFDHVEEARELFAFYLDRFVRADGTIDYYGTSLSEYGMLLDLAASLTVPEGGQEWFMRVRTFLKRLWHFLADMMNPWMHEPGSPYHLPCGSPEADRRRDRGEYFHNAAWMWRGLVSLAEKTGAWMEPEECFELEHLAGVLKRRLDRAWRERRQALGGFPPYSVAQSEPFCDCGSSVERAYANYRYYPEMLSSGAFDRESMLSIIEVREKCRGEVSGMTRLYWPEAVCEVADHWTVCAYARGLLECGEKERFMALLRSHLLDYISPDLFYAYETVTVSGSPRRAWSDWCVPAQLALPRMLLWSFVYTTREGAEHRWGGPDPAVAALFDGRRGEAPFFR